MVGKGHLQAGVCVAYGLSGVLNLVFLKVLIVILCSFFFFFYWVVCVFFFFKVCIFICYLVLGILTQDYTSPPRLGKLEGRFIIIF